MKDFTALSLHPIMSIMGRMTMFENILENLKTMEGVPNFLEWIVLDTAHFKAGLKSGDPNHNTDFHPIFEALKIGTAGMYRAPEANVTCMYAL